MDVKQIQRALRRFAQERDWEQFHSPKNLSMALVGEDADQFDFFCTSD